MNQFCEKKQIIEAAVKGSFFRAVYAQKLLTGNSYTLIDRNLFVAKFLKG